jgi:hypothetical protein
LGEARLEADVHASFHYPHKSSKGIVPGIFYSWILILPKSPERFSARLSHKRKIRRFLQKEG